MALSTTTIYRLVPVADASGASSGETLLTPEIQVMALTWITFFSLLAVLYKFAWKPILAGLDARESNIRTAVEEAEKTRAEYQQIEAKRKDILSKADQTAKDLMNESRVSAQKAAKLIEAKAKESTDILMENAKREIKNEEEKSSVFLREKSAQTAVDLARKILNEDMDIKRQRELVNKLIEDI